MTISINKIDIFNTTKDIITIPVNMVGVMGAGLALAFKNRYPLLFNTYRKVCKENLWDESGVYLIECHDKSFLMFPTKDHWRDKSDLKKIEVILSRLSQSSIFEEYKSISIPAIGAGLG